MMSLPGEREVAGGEHERPGGEYADAEREQLRPHGLPRRLELPGAGDPCDDGSDVVRREQVRDRPDECRGSRGRQHGDSAQGERPVGSRFYGDDSLSARAATPGCLSASRSAAPRAVGRIGWRGRDGGARHGQVPSGGALCNVVSPEATYTRPGC
jgi:hypothetical protein